STGRIPAERVPNNIAEIKNCAQRASDMTHQLFAFGRKQSMKAEVLEIGEWLVDTKKMLRPLLGENIELSIHPSSVPLHVMADPSQLAQVSLHLAINARDAMPQGGQLVLSIASVEISAGAALAGDEVKPGGYLRLSVRDTGEG